MYWSDNDKPDGSEGDPDLSQLLHIEWRRIQATFAWARRKVSDLARQT